MAMHRNQRFGIITFLVLLVLAIVVTMEPWKNELREAGTTMLEPSPPPIHISWAGLSDAYPESPFADSILSYKGFDLAYNEQFEQATWVAYVLTGKEIEDGKIGRTDNFRPDTSIRSGSASLADYRGSGFDRGHLAPAGDMKWNVMAMSESFLMSNMSPQSPSFNRGIWRKLEEQVRSWAIEKDSIYVITGPVLNHVNGSIGSNQVGIPSHYFKVLVDLSPPDHDFIAFLLPNEKGEGDLDNYAISVDSLENFTGIDFFAHDPNQEMIDWLEARISPEKWR